MRHCLIWSKLPGIGKLFAGIAVLRITAGKQEQKQFQVNHTEAHLYGH
jgi:hypothetical protein